MGVCIKVNLSLSLPRRSTVVRVQLLEQATLIATVRLSVRLQIYVWLPRRRNPSTLLSFSLRLANESRLSPSR